MSTLRPAIFLDRDGTLNVQVIRDGKPYPPATLVEFALFPGVPVACAQLAAAGFVLVVATNQPDVGRGDQAQSVVESMHARLRELVEHALARDPARHPEAPEHEAGLREHAEHVGVAALEL